MQILAIDQWDTIRHLCGLRRRRGILGRRRSGRNGRVRRRLRFRHA